MVVLLLRMGIPFERPRKELDMNAKLSLWVFGGVFCISLSLWGCGGGDKGGGNTSTPANIAGTWTGTATSSISGNPANISLTLSQQGENISGTITCQGCPHATGTISGTISGNTVTMGIVWPDNHSCGTFDGSVSGNSMSGQYACTDPDTGDDQGNWSVTK
jgi:hypothetical protein